jgi:hypothetical protein
LAGCSGSDDADAGGISSWTAQAMSGVYELTHFTENEAGCDAEGQSVLDGITDHHFLVTPAMVLADRVLMLVSCDGIEDCRQKRNAIENRQAFGVDYNFILTSEIDATHVAGFEASTGTGRVAGMCTERVYSDHRLTQVTGSLLRLESRSKLLADRSQTDGSCSVIPAESKSEAAGLPCGKLRVLEGTKVADPR